MVEQGSPRVRVPPWTWAFVAACVAIPVVALGGLIPSVIGTASATLCYAIAHDPDGKRSPKQSALLCAGITLLAWASFGVVARIVLWGDHSSSRSSTSGNKHRVVREQGKVVYDSRLPSKPKRPLAEVEEEERRKIYALVLRSSDKVNAKEAELEGTLADGGLTLRLESDLEKLRGQHEEHLEYVRDRFRLSLADLEALLEEGREGDWGD